jgi:sulfatase modifying factor 1
MLAMVTIASQANADTFGTGVNSFTIDFVTIGNPGNPPDANPNPAGAVPYSFRIGKYEISEQMIDKANALGGLGITKDSRGADFPATSVTWYEAAQFVNWLNVSTNHTPAYKFDSGGTFQLWLPTDPGYDATNLYRNKGAKYFLPSINEWHKAAYYDPVAEVYYDYPSGSDSVPDGIDFPGDTAFDAVFNDGTVSPSPNEVMNVGLLSPSGTAGQGGNAAEWHESEFDRANDFLGSTQRSSGGSTWSGTSSVLAAWNSGIGTNPQFESDHFGLRVASTIPEPSSTILVVVGTLSMMRCRAQVAVQTQRIGASTSKKRGQVHY